MPSFSLLIWVSIRDRVVCSSSSFDSSSFILSSSRFWWALTIVSPSSDSIRDVNSATWNKFEKFWNGTKFSVTTKLRKILRPGIAIRKKLAASWIICVWTYDEFSLSIRFDPESNTSIRGQSRIIIQLWNTNKTNKNLLKNSKMAEYYSIFARILFDIRLDIGFEVKYFDLESSLSCFIYYST